MLYADRLPPTSRLEPQTDRRSSASFSLLLTTDQRSPDKTDQTAELNTVKDLPDFTNLTGASGAATFEEAGSSCYYFWKINKLECGS